MPSTRREEQASSGHGQKPGCSLAPGWFKSLGHGHVGLAQDFIERKDLADIRGVSISQRGLAKGTRWKDLNLPFLFAALPRIEYLRVFFDDAVNLGRVNTNYRIGLDG